MPWQRERKKEDKHAKKSSEHKKLASSPCTVPTTIQPNRARIENTILDTSETSKKSSKPRRGTNNKKSTVLTEIHEKTEASGTEQRTDHDTTYVHTSAQVHENAEASGTEQPDAVHTSEMPQCYVDLSTSHDKEKSNVSSSKTADRGDKDTNDKPIEFELTFAFKKEVHVETGCRTFMALAKGNFLKSTSENTMLCSAPNSQVYNFIAAIARQSKLVTVEPLCG